MPERATYTCSKVSREGGCTIGVGRRVGRGENYFIHILLIIILSLISIYMMYI